MIRDEVERDFRQTFKGALVYTTQDQADCRIRISDWLTCFNLNVVVKLTQDGDMLIYEAESKTSFIFFDGCWDVVIFAAILFFLGVLPAFVWPTIHFCVYLSRKGEATQWPEGAFERIVCLHGADPERT